MKKRLPLLLCLAFLSGLAISQNIVSGIVTDANGEPLIGVNILVQGTAHGTVTELDGSYSLEVSDDDAILQISYTGFQTMTIPVAGQSEIDVVLQTDTQILDEVVVSALGFSENKDELGSTASIINTQDMNRSGESTLLNSLGAKASNVQISRSNGDPGAGSTIRIRGANSISGSSNPLVILDGIPISNNAQYSGGNEGRDGGVSQQSRLNDLNPNDIESIQILKGASAAALWGSRAANGVLVITTKSGKAGKGEINYKTSLSFDVVHERYPLQNTWGQGRNGKYGPTRAESWGDYIPDRSGGADGVDQGGQYFQADDGSIYYPIEQKNSQETFLDENWDAAFQTGGFIQHDLSFSGGNEKSNYYLSLGRIDQEGIIRNSDYDRTNIRLNNKFFVNDWLNVSSKASFTNSRSNRIQQSSNTAGLLLGLLRTPPDFDNRDYKGTYFNSSGLGIEKRHRSYRRYLGNSVNPTYNNPLWTTYEQESSTKVNRYIFSAEANIIPLSWLQVTLRGGIDGYDDRRVYFYPVGSASHTTGELSEDQLARLESNFDAIGRGNFRINGDISLTATLGWNLNDRRLNSNSQELIGFLVNTSKQTTDLNTAAESTNISRSRTNIRSNRGYGVLAFDLYESLFVQLSGALEASSTVRGQFFYPAAEVAYQFIRPGSNSDGPLSFGKFRASWGRVGIQAPAHAWETLAEGGFTYSTYSDPLRIGLFGGGFRLDDDRGNPDLEPEIKTEWEVGTDLRFFNDRFSLGMTYYQNNITGMIIPVDLTPSSGYDTQILNAAEMENKGFELEADYDIIRKKDLNFGVWLNWATNRNEVLDLEGTETINLTSGASVSSRAIVGQPLGVLFGTSSQMDANGNLILDQNGFPQLTPSPVVLGDPNPDWRGGLGFRFSFKNLFANALIEHSQGGEFSPRTLWVLRRFGTVQETANRITLDQSLTNFAGDEIAAGTTVRGNIEDFGGGPVLLDETWYRTGIGGGFGDNQAYNFSIYDATFTRFKELTIGYNIKAEKLKQKAGIQGIQLSATGRNLFLIDDIPGVDPEINQYGVSNGFGLDYFTNPSTKSFLFTLGLTL